MMQQSFLQQGISTLRFLLSILERKSNGQSLWKFTTGYIKPPLNHQENSTIETTFGEGKNKTTG